MQQVDDVYYWLRSTMQVRAIQCQYGEATERTVEAYAGLVLEQIERLHTSNLLILIQLPQA